MNQVCKQCSANFEIEDEDLKFYEKVSPVFNGVKYQIPPPTHCPDCRQQRRLAYSNEFNLYPANCNICKKFTLSQYPPASNLRMLCRDCWHSDQWDPKDYGRDYNFDRTFFEQILELKRTTPVQALSLQGNMKNSDYVHQAGSCKNCYLIMHADFNEDCYYGYGFKNNVSCVDGFYNLHCELCYEGVDVHKSYGLISCQDCQNCHSSYFLRDCVGTKNSFCCVGLRQKEYCFLNEQLTKEEYQAKMKEIDLGSYKQFQYWREELKELEKQHTFKEFHGHNLQNSFGDHLYNCKDVKYSFDCENVESAKYCYQIVLGSKDIYDIYQYGSNLQLSYDSAISGENSYGILFTMEGNTNSSNLIYSWYTERSNNLFGCVEMGGQSYCILNKQYTKEEYEELVPKIIEHMKTTGEWGEFMPIENSLFGYNKTSAQLYYPLTKEQVLANGWKWDDYEPPAPQVEKVIDAKDLPDNIKDIPDEILDWAIKCEVTGKLFKLTEAELKFYRRLQLPIPRRYWYQRHLDRFNKRNPRTFWQRNCDKCSKEIRTTYSPDREEKVYCEKCYLVTVY